MRGGFLGLAFGVGFLVCVGAAADTLSGRVVRTAGNAGGEGRGYGQR
jgi:hypothetical protein